MQCSITSVTVSDNTEAGEFPIVEPDSDRSRGVLTPHDRAFLLDQAGEGVRKEMSDNAIRQKRHKIRQRFRDGLIDIQYLYLLLLNDDLAEIFPQDEWGEHDLGSIHGSILAAVFFLITTYSDRDVLVSEMEELLRDDAILEYVEKEKTFAPVTVDVSINIPDEEDRVPLEELRARLQSGEELPHIAHLALVWGGMHPSPVDYPPPKNEPE